MTTPNIGWIGLGKLGLPCALTQASRGYSVFGTDINDDVRGYIEAQSIPYEEIDVDQMFADGHTVSWCSSIRNVADLADIIFVAVQTPHAPRYEGVQPMPADTRDFEYGYLEAAIQELSAVVSRPTCVVIVSTVLPGTTRRVLLPHTQRNPNIHLVYSPCFIAMGTASRDWANPEMVLAGGADEFALRLLRQAHERIHQAPLLAMSIESAEMAKVIYNTYISTKIVLANTIMEMAEKLGANCDDVTDALGKATKRLMSPKYLRGGMGDGGACHPRDCIALSGLATTLQLSADPFRFAMEARDSQTEWIGDLAIQWQELTGLSIVICGEEFKKGTKLTTGSASRLLAHYLTYGTQARFDGFAYTPVDRAIYIIGCNHEEYASWQFPKGSIVLDPWGYIPNQEGVTVKRIGRR